MTWKLYECRLCHRIGGNTRTFRPAGGDNDTWECRNDGACTRRRNRRDVAAAIRAALPPDGTIISYSDLIAAIREADPSIPSGTIGAWLSAITDAAGSGVVRVGYGRYRAT